jgi:hypothetical protein
MHASVANRRGGHKTHCREIGENRADRRPRESGVCGYLRRVLRNAQTNKLAQDADLASAAENSLNGMCGLHDL